MKKGLVWFMLAMFSLVLATPSALGQVEDGENIIQVENAVFRNIMVKGKNGDYIVEGEASAKSGTFYYLVEDGHYEFISETKITMKEKQPKWASFNIKINIPKNKLPDNGTVAIYFYEKDQNNNMIHVHATVLEQF